MTPMLSRAKDKDTGFWREGYYACESNHACFGNELKYEHFIFVDELMDWNIGGLQQYIVDPKTVGRFTGMRDKNGKMIFEGDLLNGLLSLHPDRRIFQVIYENNGFYFCDEDSVGWHPDHIVDYEVIGNIHDTPELLEGGAE